MKRIIYLNDSGRTVADRILSVSSDFEAVSYKDFDMARFQECESIVFIGALGVCVRSIAPYISDKYSDPAVVCIDSLGHNVISVLSGHVGGANALCLQLARALGANPVVTTQSDMARIWQLDTLAPRFGWIADASHEEMNRAIATLVNGRPVGLLLDVRDEGTRWLESTLPPNVRIICDCNEMPEAELIISVSPFIHNCHTPLLSFRPKVLNLGFGCRRDCNPDGIYNHIAESMIRFGVSPLSVKSVATIPLKKDERAVAHLVNAFGLNECDVYTADDLKGIDVPNPSEKVSEVTGIPGVAESCALKSADGGRLIIEKQKCKLNDGSDFTFAVAIDADAEREGHIEIVGAGPGDPELISVRGTFPSASRPHTVCRKPCACGADPLCKTGMHSEEFCAYESCRAICPHERVLRPRCARGAPAYRRPVHLWSDTGTDGILRPPRHVIPHNARNIILSGGGRRAPLSIHHTGESADNNPDSRRGTHADARARTASQTRTVTEHNVHLSQRGYCRRRAEGTPYGISSGDPCRSML